MSVNPMRHVSIFNPELFVDKQVHIIGTNAIAKNIAYLIAKLGVDNIHFHSFANKEADATAIAKYCDEMAQINPSIHIHESTTTSDVTFNDVVIVAEEILLRPEIFRNFLEVSMDTLIVIDVRIDKDGFPIIHTLKSEELFNYTMLYEEHNHGWDLAISNPVNATMIACWTTNQFITWTQQYFQMEERKDRVVQPVQTIKPPQTRVKAPLIYDPKDPQFELLKKRPVKVVGAGATGSNLVPLLVESGFEDVTVYDYDEIESHNIANQWFRLDQIGLFKVEALQKNISLYLGVTITAKNEKVVKTQPLGEIVFLLTDTMPSRKGIGQDIIKKDPAVSMFVETRMGAELFQAYAVDKTQEGAYDEWEKTLFDEAIAKPEVSACGTAITVGTTATLCSAYALNQLFHMEACRLQNNPIGFHAVMADMFPPYAIIR